LFNGYGQTTLSAGDIAIISMNTDGNDEFSFVLLRAITTGTVIKFSESGWLSGGGFRGGGNGSEGLITWTASSDLTCGTEITITSNGSVTSSGSLSLSNSWGLSTSGDQILAYQGTSAAPTFIYAINNNGAGVWQANATNANTSALPAGLTNGTNAVAVAESDNVRYDCSTTSPPATILSEVSDNSNWLSDNSTAYTLPLNCGFTCVSCTADSEPTSASTSLLFSNITCNSIELNWTTGNGNNRIVVASTSAIAATPSDQTGYTANTIFGSGDIISAGEFVVFNGAGTNFVITGLSTSTTYHFAIFEFNGDTTNCDENYYNTSLVGNNTTAFCANTDPEISGILVDACGGNEGVNEFITFTNGNSGLDIDDLRVNFPFVSSYCNSGCGSNTWVTNATYTAQLNDTAGCPGLFVEADPIPANGNVIIFTGSSPTYNFDFTDLCGTGTYYPIYANNVGTGGRFGNYNANCANLRTTSIDFASSSDTVTYQPCMLSSPATDGDYVAFANNGTPTYNNSGCTPVAILPITLTSFKGESIHNTSLLEWSTSTEVNNDYFTLERSLDATYFTEIGTVNGAGNSNYQLNYTFIDELPNTGINYYRLKQTDFNGDYSYSNTIALNNELNNAKIYTSNKQLKINLDNEISLGSIELIDVLGRTIYSDKLTKNKTINIENFIAGIYMVKIKTPTNTIIQKIKF
ncbi:MAG: T9SS type A sorting domain-containing protein, partial [Vicingaceae bacterium]